jgi:hypothetical protein
LLIFLIWSLLLYTKLICRTALTLPVCGSSSASRYADFKTMGVLYTGSSKMINLVSRYNKFREKRDVGIGLPVMCSTHKVFFNTHAYIFLRLLHKHSQYAFRCKLCYCREWYDSTRARESTVRHVVGRKQIHCNTAAQFPPYIWKKFSCRQSDSVLVMTFKGGGSAEKGKSLGRPRSLNAKAVV